MPQPTLAWEERLHYRDRFRTARYSALADAEGFGEICFAIEALGMRLLGKVAAMGPYQKKIKPLAYQSTVFSSLTESFPALFTRFEALYDTIKDARNDAMHTGAYARHATTAAIELCIGLEEALMAEQQRNTVADFMVKAPVIVEPWQPVAHARRLMLMYSFSYLPVYLNDRWHLVPEVSMARYLHQIPKRNILLATSIKEAAKNGLDLVTATIVDPTTNVEELLKQEQPYRAPMLWLVIGSNNTLCGILSPFELM